MPQSAVQPLRRWDPEHIGPYSIIGKLGAGAMGQVFLARSTTGRLVAVKTIRVELAEEPGYRARFAREVAAASRVSGVFTASVIQADAEADLPWVATAYVPAPSLSTLVRRSGPLPVPAVRWLAAGCAEARTANVPPRWQPSSGQGRAPGRSARSSGPVDRSNPEPGRTSRNRSPPAPPSGTGSVVARAVDVARVQVQIGSTSVDLPDALHKYEARSAASQIVGAVRP